MPGATRLRDQIATHRHLGQTHPPHLPTGSQARRRCPSAVVLPPRLRVYQAVSERVFSVVREVVGPLEQVALDEAFTEPAALSGADEVAVEEFARLLRERVRHDTGLVASVGAGSGKQVAKIASGLAKPDGLRIVSQGREREVLAPLPVRRLWGIGPVAEAALRRVGVDTIGALASLTVSEATSLLAPRPGWSCTGWPTVWTTGQSPSAGKLSRSPRKPPSTRI